jgi:hypothetical protein
MAATMARRKPKGNRRPGLFPRLLWGRLSQAFYSKAFIEPFVEAFTRVRITACETRVAGAQAISSLDQLFRSDLIFLSNSSNEISPLITSPLMKKVGVEFTFSTSDAYF